MSGLDTSSLMDSISQLRQIQPDVLNAMVDEIESAGVPYKRLYDDYQSGGWYTAVLYARLSVNFQDSSDATVRDGVASPTPLAESLPIIRGFLDALGLEFFTVRLARSDNDAWLWEHRDYVELDEEKKRSRLHIPLVTSERALIQFPQCAVHMASGWI